MTGRSKNRCRTSSMCAAGTFLARITASEEGSIGTSNNRRDYSGTGAPESHPIFTFHAIGHIPGTLSGP